MKTHINNLFTSKESFTTLKDTWKPDLIAGFMIFLLALPLSLGIAKASGFPAAMGVLTAIFGGILSIFFNVAPLTIKGPAAGLITICSGAVLAFGGGDTGWKVAAAAIIVAAILQMIFAILKFGTLSDFFPHSAVHGMLAAIGIIIIVKQIPVLLGDDPSLYTGESPIGLIMDIPLFITHAHAHIAVVGIIGLVIMFGLPMLGFNFLKKIPAPMVVLTFTIPLAIYWHFKSTEPSYSLVQIGDFWGSMDFNFDFSQISKPLFWKFVLMFLFVNSLESLLTVKAIDSLDPQKRVSNSNGDLLGVGTGNFVSGLLGGLPMISEVVRSSANVGFGAKTKWANFFHSIFLLLAMIFIIPFIETIPNAALAAMLIYAGFRLAAPKQFIHVFEIGKEQLAIFLVTIIVTLFEDLLLGIFAGILVKLIFHLFNGLSFSSIFKLHFEVEEKENEKIFKIKKSAVFSNILSFKSIVNKLNEGDQVTIDFSKTKLIDHSFLSFIDRYKNEFEETGGTLNIVGMEKHVPFSKHELATRKLKKQQVKELI